MVERDAGHFGTFIPIFQRAVQDLVGKGLVIHWAFCDMIKNRCFALIHGKFVFEWEMNKCGTNLGRIRINMSHKRGMWLTVVHGRDGNSFRQTVLSKNSCDESQEMGRLLHLQDS